MSELPSPDAPAPRPRIQAVLTLKASAQDALSHLPGLRRYLASMVRVNGRPELASTLSARDEALGWAEPAGLFLLGAGMVYGFWDSVLILPLGFVFMILLAWVRLRGHLRWLNHLKWRNQPLKLEVKPGPYLLLCARRLLINLISFGYAVPRSDLMKWDLLVKGARLGERAAVSKASFKKIGWINVVSLWIPLTLIVSFLMTLGTMPDPDTLASEQEKVTVASQLDFLGILMVVTLVCGVYGRAWYHAALRAELLEGLSVGGVKFASTASGKDVAKHYLMNTLLLGCTLGLALPVVLQRGVAFRCRFTEITMPAPTPKPAAAPADEAQPS